MFKVAGTSQPRLEAVEKATGQAQYAGDLKIPGMLYGKVLRSPYPHARVIRVDAREAEKLPGVVAVLTREDLADLQPFFGVAYKDEQIVAMEKVKHEGDAVAAVAAVDEGVARAALDLIRVEYQELPAVFDLREALKPGAPLVNESMRPAGHFVDLRKMSPEAGSNICHHFHYERGDLEQAFKEAEFLFQDEYTFPMVHHYSMEPHATIAHYGRDEITVWSSTQHPFPVRKELAGIFRVPQNKVRIIVPYIGGAYGCKSYTRIEPLVVALSRKAKAPVRVALTVEEDFRLVRRCAVICRLKTGVRCDGTLIARHCEAFFDVGAYAVNGPRVAQKAGYTGIGPYHIPHLRVDAYAVYTNTAPNRAFRGYGVPQVAWAYESQMDDIGHKLGIDALELRLKNLLRRGEEYAKGDLPMDADYSEGLRKVARAIGWGRKDAVVPAKPWIRRGKGLACSIKASLNYSVSSAIVRLNADGTLLVHCSTVEIGQGTRTILAQIVAEELSVPLHRVTMVMPDTHVTPYDQATSASRSTTLMGKAIQAAAQDVRNQLIQIVASQWRVPAESLRVEEGKVVGSQQAIDYEDVVELHFGMRGGEIIGKGFSQSEKSDAPLGAPTPFWEVGMSAAEVEVDTETGQVRLARYVTAADVGKALNPLQCRGQDEGAALFGIGHTFMEKMVYEGGRLINPNIVDYRIPTFEDLPDEFESILIENQDGAGPYGAKGMGESGSTVVSPAVGNALYNALGIRFRELPITPERVLRALKGRKD